MDKEVKLNIKLIEILSEHLGSNAEVKQVKDEIMSAFKECYGISDDRK